MLGDMTVQVSAADLSATLTKLRPAFHGSASTTGSHLVRLVGAKGKLALQVAGYHARAGHRWLSASTLLPVKGDGTKLVAIVPFASLADLAALAEDPKSMISLSLEDDVLLVSVGQTRVSLRCTSPDGTIAMSPSFPAPETWNAPALGGAAKYVAPAASHDEARPILTGVFVHEVEPGSLTMAATDSYRLGMVNLKGEAPPGRDGKILIPWGVATLLPDEPTVLQVHGDVALSWDADDVHWSASLVTGEFPNYRGLVPKSFPNHVRLPRDPLMRLLKRVSVFQRIAKQNHSPVVLKVDPSGVGFSMNIQDFGTYEDYLACEVPGLGGDEFKVAFNTEYLMAGVRSTVTPVLDLKMVDAQKPAVLGSEVFTYLLMPVRIS